jgi:hypothetical protein
VKGSLEQFFQRYHRISGFVAGLLVVLSAGGCVDHPVYPSSWSPLRTSVGADCSGLSGNYNSDSIGKSFDGNSPVSLARDLYNLSDRPNQEFARSGLEKVAVVRLTVTDSHLRAEMVVNDSSSIEIVIALGNGSAKCTGNLLEIYRGTADAAPFSFAGGRQTTIFYRANDGTLVERFGRTEVGTTMLIIPFGESHYDWVKFGTEEPPN